MAVFNSYAVASPTYQPAMRMISAISNATHAAVTTTFDHNYSSGLIVRMYVPKWYGMTQINKKDGIITVTGSTTFTIDIDSMAYDSFSIPSGTPWYVNTFAMVVPVGEINSSLQQATRNVL